jgi:hypothetical protein
VIDDPTTPVLLVLAVIPIALVAALVIGAWPAWSAGRGHAAAGLHDE